MARRTSRYDSTLHDHDENSIGLTRAFTPVEDDYVDGVIPTDPFETATFNPITDHVRTPQNVEPLTRDDVRRASSVSSRARHAKPAHAKSENSFVVSPDSDQQKTQGSTVNTSASNRSRRENSDEIPAYMRKSKRMRRVLIAVIVVMIILLCAGGYFVWQLFQTAQSAAVQQTQSVMQDIETINESGDAKDVSTVTEKRTTVPDLRSLLGLNLDQSIEALQHGAQVSSTREVNEEGNPIKSEVRVALTAEPADSRSGTPTVYLGLNAEGIVIQAGYSASTAALGYGSLSFADAVRNESIVEKTLQEAGLPVSVGSAQLPEDKAAYSTYATDGTTLTREYCSFNGQVDVDGSPLNWSSVLSYDYSMANATGNLADTIRIIYIYVSNV